MKLSVIIPSYKAEKFIVKNIEKFKKQLEEIKKKYSFYISDWEIVLVIDGINVDNSYSFAKKIKKIKVFSYPENRGKGYALKFGFQKSTGDYITFLDVDGDIPLWQIGNFFPYLSTHDIVIGSKRHPFSKVNYSFFRKMLSKIFQICCRVIVNVSLKDTQSGLKLIKRQALDAFFFLSKMERFSFDIELCFLATKHGFNIAEVPIQVNLQKGTTIEITTPFKMFFDLIKIRYCYSIKKEYQKKFHQNKFKT